MCIRAAAQAPQAPHAPLCGRTTRTYVNVMSITANAEKGYRMQPAQYPCSLIFLLAFRLLPSRRAGRRLRVRPARVSVWPEPHADSAHDEKPKTKKKAQTRPGTPENEPSDICGRRGPGAGAALSNILLMRRATFEGLPGEKRRRGRGGRGGGAGTDPRRPANLVSQKGLAGSLLGCSSDGA